MRPRGPGLTGPANAVRGYLMSGKTSSPPGAPAPIGQIIGALMQRLTRDCHRDLAEIGDVWDRVVGAAIAANARPAAFKGRELLVYVSSSAWLQQLHFLKAEILQELNSAVGKPLIESINFKIGTWPG